LIAFFCRPYKVKRFGKERIVDGYTSSGYVDISPVPLDVQEQDYTVTSEANGKRSPKTLNAYGQFKFVAAESPETRGDLIQGAMVRMHIMCRALQYAASSLLCGIPA
jgi:hypothetical protein